MDEDGTVWESNTLSEMPGPSLPAGAGGSDTGQLLETGKRADSPRVRVLCMARRAGTWHSSALTEACPHQGKSAGSRRFRGQPLGHQSRRARYRQRCARHGPCSTDSRALCKKGGKSKEEISLGELKIHLIKSSYLEKPPEYISNCKTAIIVRAWQ